jgi:hypothetical protein
MKSRKKLFIKEDFIFRYLYVFTPLSLVERVLFLNKYKQLFRVDTEGKFLTNLREYRVLHHHHCLQLRTKIKIFTLFIVNKIERYY